MWILFWALSGGAIFIIGFLSLRSWNNYQKYKSLRSLPSPKGNWLLGNAAQLLKAAKENRFNTLRADWAKKYGKIYVSWIGNKPILTLSDFQLLEETIASGLKEGTLVRDPKLTKAWSEVFGGEVMIQKDGQEWKWRRQTFNQSFNSKQIQAYFETVEKACSQVVDLIKQKVEKQEVIQVDPVFSELTMRIISRLLLGIRLDSKNNQQEGPALEPEKLYQALSVVTSRFITKVAGEKKWVEYLPTKKNQDYSIAKGYLHNFVESRVNLAMKIARTEQEIDSVNISSEFKESILVRLAKQAKFTKTMLCAEAIGVMFAGTDTTAHTLSFTVGALGLNPAVLKKARAIVDNVWEKNGGIIPESLKELTYIQGVIKESMRLYPVTNGGTGWIAKSDMKVRNINIPNGTKIAWSLTTAARNPDEYRNPNQFMPERWLEESRDSSSLTFLFFGLGPHRCLGESLAILEATVMLTMLIRHFDWEVVNGQESLENLGQNLTVFPSDRMPVKFKLRKVAERTVNVN